MFPILFRVSSLQVRVGLAALLRPLQRVVRLPRMIGIDMRTTLDWRIIAHRLGRRIAAVLMHHTSTCVSGGARLQLAGR